MQKRHAIKMLSYRRIRQVLNDNSTAVVSAKVMTDSKNGFDSHLNRIEGILVPDAKATKPTTAYKNEVLNELANGLVPIMDGVLLYANDTNNTALSGQIPASPTALLEGNEVSCFLRLRTVLDACKSVPMPDLENYGVEATQLNELTAKLALFDNLLGTSRIAIDARVLLRAEQDNAFEAMDSFLSNTLDRAVRNRQPKFPNFVAAYFQARKLHDMSSQSLEAEIADLEALDDAKSLEPSPAEALGTALTAVENGKLEINGVH